jgi:hypothetical protein
MQMAWLWGDFEPAFESRAWAEGCGVRVSLKPSIKLILSAIGLV